jgi:hypothetical protein
MVSLTNISLDKIERTLKMSRAQAFLDEIAAVYYRHGLALSHQDQHGAFVVEKLEEHNISWLYGADTDNIDTAESLETENER